MGTSCICFLKQRERRGAGEREGEGGEIRTRQKEGREKGGRREDEKGKREK